MGKYWASKIRGGHCDRICWGGGTRREWDRVRSISGPLSFFSFSFSEVSFLNFFCSLFFFYLLRRITMAQRAVGFILANCRYISHMFVAIPARDAETGGHSRASKNNWKRKVWARSRYRHTRCDGTNVLACCCLLSICWCCCCCCSWCCIGQWRCCYCWCCCCCCSCCSCCRCCSCCCNCRRRCCAFINFCFHMAGYLPSDKARVFFSFGLCFFFLFDFLLGEGTLCLLWHSTSFSAEQVRSLDRHRSSLRSSRVSRAKERSSAIEEIHVCSVSFFFWVIDGNFLDTQ